MRSLTIALAAAGAVGTLALGSAFAHGPGAEHPGAGRTMGMHATGAAKLWILHVARGCHSWSDGKRVAETVRLTINRGGRLVIVNQDVDMHQLVQTAGSKVATGAPMMMNHRVGVVFRRSGTYRFKTRVLEMEGMMDVKTIGPDHALRLVVTVK